MSVEDIIRSWKASDDNDDDSEKAPENPAGEQELSDEELAKAAGGLAKSHSWNQGDDDCGFSSAGAACDTTNIFC